MLRIHVIAGLQLSNNLPTPNVSAIEGSTDVYYNPYEAPHEYVEIGGIKWATMNLGATAVTDAGLYFQWGDTQGYTADQVGSGEGQKMFKWSDYKYCDGTGDNMTKYNSADGKTVLDLSDDAVNASWGGNWRMPTTDEFAALGAAVNTAWTADYQGKGVAGAILTDKTDSSKILFFPAGGNCAWGSRSNFGFAVSCWSCSLDNDVNNSMELFIRDNQCSQSDRGRFAGLTLRGILDE